MTATPEPPAGKLLVELAGQKPPPDFWEELKKRLKGWAKKWSIRVGAGLALLLTNLVSYQYGKGTDLSWLFNLAVFASVAAIVAALLNKVK